MRPAALDYVHRLLIAEIQRVVGSHPTRILDLDCGTGATLLHLAKVFPVTELLGVTHQAAACAIAQRAAQQQGVAERCRFLCADPAAVDSRAEVILLSNALSRSQAPESLLHYSQQYLAKTGTAFILDHFLTEAHAQLSPDTCRLLEGLQQPGLMTLDHLESGLEHLELPLASLRDLSGLVQPHPWQATVLAGASRLLRPFSWRGHPWPLAVHRADALNQCLHAGLLRYCMLTARRIASRHDGTWG